MFEKILDIRKGPNSVKFGYTKELQKNIVFNEVNDFKELTGKEKLDYIHEIELEKEKFEMLSKYDESANYVLETINMVLNEFEKLKPGIHLLTLREILPYISNGIRLRVKDSNGKIVYETKTFNYYQDVKKYERVWLDNEVIETWTIVDNVKKEGEFYSFEKYTLIDVRY